MRVLWLVPDLGYTAVGRQCELVVPELEKLGVAVTVAAMRAGRGLATGLPVLNLATRQDLPLRVLFELQALLRTEAFDVVHAWRLPALRAMASVRVVSGHRGKLVVSEPRRGGRWTLLDRLLPARADRIAPEDAPRAVPRIEPAPWPRRLRLPPDARVIVGLGDFTRERGFRDAAWAFDVLSFVYPELHLVLIGEGPERARVLDFVRSIKGAEQRVHFLPEREPGPGLLHHAVAVWIPSRRPCGEQVAAEAQAIGVPVVATRWPGMERILDDGRAGALVPPGDPVALAMATRPILDDPARGAELVAAGRKLATGRTPATAAVFWRQLYSQLAAG